MEPIIISKDSWHAKLIKWVGTPTHQITDICSYRGNVLGAMILVTFLVLSASMLVVWPVIDISLLLFNWAATGSLDLTKLSTITYVVVVIAIIACFFWCINTIVTMCHEADWPDDQKTRGFIGTMWRSYKDKYCAKIIIK